MAHTLFTRSDAPGTLWHNFRVRFVGDAKATRWKRKASSNNRTAAKKEGALILAKAIELQRIPDEKQEDTTRFSGALEDYLKFEARTAQTFDRFQRIAKVLQAMGNPDPELAEFNQAFLGQMREAMFPGPVKASTVRTSLFVPMTALLNNAHANDWCAAPHFRLPKIEPSEPLYFTPAEAERVIAEAAPHLKPLLIFMFGTGCRVSEAIYLDWHEVNLETGIAAFLATKTKGGKRRNAKMPPAAIAALVALGPKSHGPVFKTAQGPAYIPKQKGGGQIEHAFEGACERAGLGGRGFHPHCTRHSWATWHYAVHKDMLLLKHEGGWSSLNLVEVYTHIAGDCPIDAIKRIWGLALGLRVIA